MLSYFEERRRIGLDLYLDLYKVRSWYLFGFVLVFRQYEQLTARATHAMPSELSE
jgi:hypothetical protein